MLGNTRASGAPVKLIKIAMQTFGARFGQKYNPMPDPGSDRYGTYAHEPAKRR